MKLYHGTSSELLPSIKKKGLYTTRDEPYTVCFTDNIDTAVDYAYEIYTFEGTTGTPVVLEIEIPSRYIKRVSGPDEFQLKHSRILDPKFIKRVLWIKTNKDRVSFKITKKTKL